MSTTPSTPFLAPEGFIQSSRPADGTVPDQFVFITKATVFNADVAARYQRAALLTVTEAGESRKLAVHLEFFHPLLPILPQVAIAWALAAMDGLFVTHVAQQLVLMLHPAWDWTNPLSAIAFLSFLDNNSFKLFRIEIPFDTPSERKLVRVLDRDLAYNCHGTVYLPPVSRRYRIVKTSWGERRESKSRTDSILVEYARGKKLGTGAMQRFEIRLDRTRLKTFSLLDLFLPFTLWTQKNRSRISAAIRRQVPPGTFAVDYDLLDSTHPMLARILRDAGVPHLAAVGVRKPSTALEGGRYGQ
ncbi:MAG: hypothetical protein WCG80_06830 [Spirochaetales bacterium]